MKNDNNSFPKSLLVTFIIIMGAIGITANLIKLYKVSHKKEHHVEYVYENEDYVTKASADKKSIQIEMKDKQTNKRYNLNVSPDFYKTADMKYYKNNKKLVEQAADVYEYIIGTEYYTEKYCEPYQSINNFKREYSKVFKQEKQVAENILKKTFGANFERLIQTMIDSPDFYEEGIKLVEEQYMESKEIWKEENPSEGFTRRDFCEGIDDWDASDIEEVYYETFKEMYPDF